MIGFYVLVTLKDGCEEKFCEILKEIIPASRLDKGCISYECGKILSKKNQYAFMESWENLSDQEAHMQSAHMLKYAPLMHKMYESHEVNIIKFV